MNLPSVPDWQPITRTQLESRLHDEVSELPPDLLKIYKARATDLAELPCFRSEQCGIERVFVVAKLGLEFILFDDDEDEFGVGMQSADGILRDWELFGSLAHALRALQTKEAI